MGSLNPQRPTLELYKLAHISLEDSTYQQKESSISAVKKEIREKIWKYLEDHELTRFPRPVYNRIPNFVGADKAAALIRQLKEFSNADCVKVNPDAPQAYIRQIVLEEKKVLLMPTPRLKEGFLLLNSKRIPPQMTKTASSISGAFKLAERVSLSKLPQVNLVVAGSVAVSLEGCRIGKGEGYSEFEYGILRELELVNEETKIVTSVHTCQIVRSFPLEEHDIPVDYILTPTGIHETRTTIPKPRGIYWKRVTSDMLERMPALKELQETIHSK